MTETKEKGEVCSNTTNIIYPLAAFVIVIAGVIAAKTIIIPILLSAFIAVICSPPLFWLEGRGLPKTAAFVVVLSVFIAVFLGVVAVLGTSANDFKNHLDDYKSSFRGIVESTISTAEKYHIPLEKSVVMKHFDPGMLFGLAGQMISGIGSMLSQTVLIFITVAFILFETASFPKKLEALRAGKKPSEASPAAAFTKKINSYLAIKTMTSLATGVLVGISLAVLKVDFPFMWGMLAFFLNFIPNIGSFIAAVPAILLALVQLGPMTALLTAVVYTVINFVIGNIIEPKYMGKGLGLSSLVVFLSLVFWGWVLGPVGMFLSVPLTMTLKLLCDSRESTKPIGILLGP